jgi:EAL domain-containing protein (putative c-di-GMP-specific phosphodiesterase class I)
VGTDPSVLREGLMIVEGPQEELTVGSVSAAPDARRAILVLDDDVLIGRTLGRLFTAAGYDVTVTTEGRVAIEAVVSRPFDVIVSDIMMPRMTGVEFLRRVRAHDLDVPVILMTGNPTVETAVEAVALGAIQYLAKPVRHDEILKAVERASMLHRLAQMKRDALKLLGSSSTEAGDRAGLHAGFDRCLGSMWMAFQPILDTTTKGVLGYEALMRSREASMPHPGTVLTAAERTGRLLELGRRVRSLTAAAFTAAPPSCLLFVNLHTRDLLDPELYDGKSGLAAIADRVVLEVTERASLDDVSDILSRVQRLRAMGFRIAIDDLGAGYAGLSSFAALEPDFVKLDMSLVRDVHRSSIRQRLIGSITRLCKDLGMRVVAEGIESIHERDAIRELGCDLLQGHLFAMPGPPFPELAETA